MDASLRQHFQHVCARGELKGFLQRSVFLVDTRARLHLCAQSILRDRWQKTMAKQESDDASRALGYHAKNNIAGRVSRF